MLAVAAVAVLTVGTGPARPAAAPAPARPAALRHFNPLVPYISFGWLPAGQKLVAGDTRPELQALIAGRHSWTDRSVWDLVVYAAGQCRLTGQATQLTCSTPALEGLTATITRPAPAVRGHRAFWAGPDLIWQYARGGWAALALPYPADFPRLATPAQLRKAGIRPGGSPRTSGTVPPRRRCCSPSSCGTCPASGGWAACSTCRRAASSGPSGSR